MVWPHPEHGWGIKQTEQEGVGGNAGKVDWKHGKHCGGVVGWGQFWGQKGRVVVVGQPEHGCGIKQAEQEGAGVGGKVWKVGGAHGIHGGGLLGVKQPEGQGGTL